MSETTLDRVEPAPGAINAFFVVHIVMMLLLVGCCFCLPGGYAVKCVNDIEAPAETFIASATRHPQRAFALWGPDYRPGERIDMESFRARVANVPALAGAEDVDCVAWPPPLGEGRLGFPELVLPWFTKATRAVCTWRSSGRGHSATLQMSYHYERGWYVSMLSLLDGSFVSTGL